jgi:hypothetical protein
MTAMEAGSEWLCRDGDPVVVGDAVAIMHGLYPHLVGRITGGNESSVQIAACGSRDGMFLSVSPDQLLARLR